MGQAEPIFDMAQILSAAALGASVSIGIFGLLGLYLFVRGPVQKQIRVWLWEQRQRRGK